MQTVFVTGADRGIGLALCKYFLGGGWRVFAGQYMTHWKELEALKYRYPDKLHLIPLDISSTESISEAAQRVKKKTDTLDMLVNCAGIAGFEDTPEQIRQFFRVNTLGTMCTVEYFLPLMERGLRRLCFVSSEAGSISVAHRTGVYGYGMSKSSLNMAVRMMFNQLQPKGYTFRLYHPGWVRSYMLGEEKATVGKYEPEEAAQVAYESFVESRECEDVLVMTDIQREMWPF